MMEGEQASYAVKRVDFFGRSVKICMQNNNGPCPLLAIANVLSFRNELKLPSGIRSITQSNLITAIVDLLLERSKHLEEASAADYQQTISDIFPVLQKLTTGIDVNVKFHNSHAFEATPEVAVFDLLGIPLVHGWLIDPQDADTAAVFGNKSYNELVELLLLGLDDAEREQLATGPLRSLSFTPSHSFTGTRDQEHPRQQETPQPFTQLQEQQKPDVAQLAAQVAADNSAVTPNLRRIATPSASDAATADPAGQQAVADTADPQTAAAADSNGNQFSGTDAVIEQVLEDIVQHICCEPDRIELGDSPTLSTKINRKLAYAGPAPQVHSSSAIAAADQHEHQQRPLSAAAAAANLNSSSNGANPSSSSAATAAAAGLVTPPQHQQRQPLASFSTGVKPGAKAAADARVVRRFMEIYCSQLTPFGLASLAENLKEHQLAVFFRNNHFNTLFKYEGGVYLLVTDQGYECEPDIVWERLDSVNGDTTFCTGDFTAFVPHRDPNGAPTYSQVAGGVHPAMTDFDAAIAASLAAADGGHPDLGHNMLHDVKQHQDNSHEGWGGSAHEDADFALALQLQLQEEESARVAQERQQQQQAGQGRPPQQQQQPRVQQLQQQQQQPAAGQFNAESLAAGARQFGRRIVSSAEKAASNLQQQRQQYVQQQQALHAAQQQQQQQGPQAQHQRQYMMQQEQQRHQRRAQAAGGRKQQEEKCSIM